MTIKDFLNAGYEKFDLESSLSICLLQKRIVDKKGIKYFIDILPYKIIYMTVKPRIGFIVKLQFQKNGDAFKINIFDNPNNTIQRIEQLCEELWKNNKFEYYEKKV